MKYRFEFSGQLAEGAKVAKVERNLAKLFSSTEQELQGLFNGSHEFVREGLDETAARSYVALFKRAGAIGKISKSNQTEDDGTPPPEPQSSSDQSTLERTDSETDGPDEGDDQNTDAQRSSSSPLDQQAQFGEHVAQSLRAAATEINDESGQGPDISATAPKQTTTYTQFNRKQSKAARWLRIGGLAIVGTMIADNQLQNALIIDRHGMDLGYWPLLLAHIPLLIGCYLLAQEKRLSPIFGALGLLSFAGLSILLLMPEKGAKQHKIGLGAAAMTVFSCAVFVYWFGGALRTSADTQSYYERLASLHEGREEFPSTMHQGQPEAYRSERSELHELMNEIIELANSDALRPDDATELANEMMNELARYIAWRQYQQFLHYTQDLKLPDALSEASQKSDAQFFGALLNGITPNSNKRLYESMLSWTVGRVNEKEYAKGGGIRKQLDHIFDATRDGWILQLEAERDAQNSATDAASSSKSDPGKRPAVDLAKLNLPKLSGAELNKHEHHVEYVFKSGPFTGKTLAIGFYTKKNPPRWNKKVSYSPTYKVLNNAIPAKFMSNLISVFSDYRAIPPF